VIHQRPTERRNSAVDLLADFSELAESLLHELKTGSDLDAFLLAAGMNQVLEDHLHRESIPLSRLEQRMGALPFPLAQVLPGAARGAAALSESARVHSREQKRLLAVQPTLAGLTQHLAIRAVDELDGSGSSQGSSTPAGENRAAEPVPAAERSRLLQLASRLVTEVRRLQGAR
jgi:hypothetical protein